MSLLAFVREQFKNEAADNAILQALDENSFLVIFEPTYPIVLNSIFNPVDIYSYKDTLVFTDEFSLRFHHIFPSQKKIFWVYSILEDTSVLTSKDYVTIAGTPECAQMYNIPEGNPKDVRFDQNKRDVL